MGLFLNEVVDCYKLQVFELDSFILVLEDIYKIYVATCQLDWREFIIIACNLTICV